MLQGILLPFLAFLTSLPMENVEYSPTKQLFSPYIADPLVPRMSLNVETLDELNLPKTSTYRFDFTTGTYLKLTRIYFKNFILESDIGAAIHHSSDIRYSSDIIGYDGIIDSGISIRTGNLLLRYAYKHVSSHRGDEYIIKNADYHRENFTTNESTFAIAYYLNDQIRAYMELGINLGSLKLQASSNLRYQFGLEYQPSVNGIFAATDIQITPEWNQQLSVNFVTGYALISNKNERIYRIALSLYSGRDKVREFSYNQITSAAFGFILDL